VVGHGASTAFDYSVVLGYFAKSHKTTGDVATEGANVIIGYGASSYTHCSVALGFSAINYGPAKLVNNQPVYDEETGNKIILGRNSVAIGNTSYTNNNSAIAIGHDAVANGENSTAIGKSAQAFQENSTAIGNGAVNNVENSVVIGNGAVKSTTLGAITITTDGESTITFTVGTKSFTINLT
jgi:autotransporter adhesin